MNCLKDILCGRYSLVGIRDFVHCAHPDNILYINNMPGIKLKSAAAIASDEHRSGYEMLNEKIKFATQKVFHRFSTIVADSFDFNAFIEAREISKFNTTVIPKENLDRGLVLRRWRSEMARIYIEEVYIKVKQSGIAIITVLDGDHVKYYQVSLLANITNVVKINYKCNSEHVYITFNQENFDTYSCALEETTGCRTCGTARHANHRLQVSGWNGEEEVEGCFGLGVLANVQCYEEEILCQLLPRMNFMIYYQAAIDIFDEHLVTGRVNPVAVFQNVEKSLENAIMELAIEEKQFKNNITNFLKTTRGECFTCKGSRYGYALP